MPMVVIGIMSMMMSININNIINSMLRATSRLRSSTAIIIVANAPAPSRPVCREALP